MGQITSDVRLTRKEKQPKEEAETRAQAKWMWAHERNPEQPKRARRRAEKGLKTEV